ncbi:lasso peptide biosynthesis PqqD family chaperone [Streptomyces sp. SCA3-4]|uniref:lasso peptide biosynthesis PqqD family chaperone n=1 Tax=Streptomyces sichuanensis TaxID=2871810 RepID=UPI001CE304F0|nr:lasso peptide biosynthesis PqqD family chaperone [Streptomyces sichuanensis]MCA6091107.1 lasso peptide biosynthesis PqqD family chaperone [Streptomyces sichuanensis]
MTLVLQPWVSTTRAEHGMVLLNEATGRYWQLNGTAALVLGTLLDGAPQQEAARRLAERYPHVDAEQAAHDVATLVASLRRARLVMTA